MIGTDKDDKAKLLKKNKHLLILLEDARSYAENVEKENKRLREALNEIKKHTECEYAFNIADKSLGEE